MLLWGILWIWYYTGTLEYDLINLSSTPYVSTFLGFAILVGAMGKSAQILFHVWLPNAMEGGLIIILYFMFFCKYFMGPVIFLYVVLSVLNLLYMHAGYLFYSLFNYLDGNFVMALIVITASNKRSKAIITPYQQEAICGLILSDGCLSDPNNRGVISPDGSYRLEFTFKQASLEFVKWLKFEVLGSVCTKTAPTPYPKDKPTQYWFSSSQLDYFTKLAQLWYIPHPNPTPRLKVLKVLPPIDYLEAHFTAVALAFMIMGDGYWENDSDTIFICTEGFSNKEVDLLISLLDSKLGLKATPKLRDGRQRIRFSSAGNNLKKLKELVLPYMHPSMLYKLEPKV